RIRPVRPRSGPVPHLLLSLDGFDLAWFFSFVTENGFPASVFFISLEERLSVNFRELTFIPIPSVTVKNIVVFYIGNNQ
ncbi:MAG: hypothetical protein OXH80_08885, partial [Nitrospira sp.]|nr:hypothetical protein [Nitrospira sp.]